MPTPTYMTSIQVDVFESWNNSKTPGSSAASPHRTKVYYDLVELTPDQIKVIVKMTAILSRGIYDSHLPQSLEEQVTGELNINCPE